MSTLYEKARYGLPLEDVLVIDSHCHIGKWWQFHIPGHTAEDMLTSMDRLGLNKAFITAHSAIGPDYTHGNDMVIDAVKRYPERFIGYATVNPNYESDMKNELDRCFSVNGIRGIKLHPGCHGAAIDYKKYRIAYETANELACPVLIHVWGKADVDAIDRVSALYPQARFVIGHSGADIHAMEDAIEVVKSRDNAYLDLAVSVAFEGNVEWFVSEVGSTKVLYGSDMPFLDPRPALGRVAMADITDDEKKNILGLNMKSILEGAAGRKC